MTVRLRWADVRARVRDFWAAGGRLTRLRLLEDVGLALLEDDCWRLLEDVGLALLEDDCWPREAEELLAAGGRRC